MDSELLRYYMSKKKITVEKLCQDLNMSRTAFYRKTHGTSEFTITEIQKIVEYLDLDSPMAIFFPNSVSNETLETV